MYFHVIWYMYHCCKNTPAKATPRLAWHAFLQTSKPWWRKIAALHGLLGHDLPKIRNGNGKPPIEKKTIPWRPEFLGNFPASHGWERLKLFHPLAFSKWLSQRKVAVSFHGAKGGSDGTCGVECMQWTEGPCTSMETASSDTYSSEFFNSFNFGMIKSTNVMTHDRLCSTSWRASST